MNRRDEKPYFTDASIGKLQEARPDLFIVKIGELLADFSFFYLDARMVLNIIILAGIAFFQDLINRLASGAAKWLFIENQRVCTAVFTAVVTDYLSGFFQFRGQDFFAKLLEFRRLC